MSKSLKQMPGIGLSVLLAFYLFLLYELVMVPAILDWSVYGVALTLALAGLLIVSLPRPVRLQATVLGFAFLLAVRALDNVSQYPVFKHVMAGLAIFLVLLVTGKLLGKFRIRQFTAMFLVAVYLSTAIDISQARFWPEFTVIWESPILYKRYASVDYFPVRLADVDGDGSAEILTQANLEQAEKEKAEVAEKGKRYQILEPENSQYAVLKWKGDTFTELSPAQYSLEKAAASLPADYLGFPLYETQISLDKTRGFEQKMTPYLDRSGLVEQAVRFGSFPFAMVELNQKSLDSRLKSQQLVGFPSEATGNFISGAPLEKAVITDTLRVIEQDSGKTIAALDESLIPYIGTTEVLAADVDNDKTDELLLTAETSRILKPTADGRWQNLWVSPEDQADKNRFQHFRFEDFAPLGTSEYPYIIALSKSNVRENPTRYMTGYVYKNGALEQKWRVFSGLINLRAGDVDGDGRNELVGYMYRSQRLFVLKKHDIPVTYLLYGITALLVLTGLAVQRRQKSLQAAGGEPNV